MLIHGDIVRLKCDFRGDTQSSLVGKLAVIEYSYGEIYGNGECYGGYRIVDMETGESSSWWNEGYLEFITHGGDRAVKRAKRIAINREIKEREESLKRRKVPGGEVLTEIEKMAMRERGYLEKSSPKVLVQYERF